MRSCGTSVTEVTHLFFGDEVGRVRDPYGNLWWIQTHIEDVSEEEMTRRLTDPEFTRAMEYVSGGAGRGEANPPRPSTRTVRRIRARVRRETTRS
jgi:hypothetical protein